jgi:hypothetical protein
MRGTYPAGGDLRRPPDLDVAVLSVPLRCAVAPDHEPARFAIGVSGQRARTHLGWDHAVTGQPLLTE